MATCAEKLEIAEGALHDLLIGKRIVSVSYGERRMQYTEANIAGLRAYIAELKAECGEDTTAARRRPLRPLF